MWGMLPPLYAHRLGRAYGPDSSAAALRGALAAGVDGLESDVCLTADGALVLLHDPYLPLGTDLEGFAHERTARELRCARLRDRVGRLTAEAPLFVEDLLAATPRDVVIQLEVKAPRRLRARRAHGGRADGAPARPDALAADRGAVVHGGGVRASGGARLPCAACRVGRLRPGGAGPLGPPTRSRRGVCGALRALAAAHRRAAPRRVERYTGTLNEPALLDRVLPLRPDAVTSDRPHTLREAAASVPSLAA